MNTNLVVPKLVNLKIECFQSNRATALRNIVVLLSLSQKSSGFMEPLEPPLTPAPKILDTVT